MIKKVKEVVFAALLLFLTKNIGLADPISEYDLKAAYLLNFAGYVEWPNLKNKSVRICVYGENPFKASTIAVLVKEKSGQIDVHFTYPRQLAQLAECNILYLASSEQGDFDRIIASLHNAPVLTVSDIADDFPSGVMINLLFESNRLAFEVRMDPILESKLRISSKLLKLAKKSQ